MRFLELDEAVETDKTIIGKSGGLCGVRDHGLLESALANPQNLYHYQDADIYILASSYAISIIKNHPFLDGNKRSGFLAMDLFLRMNSIKLKFPEEEAVETMVNIATSSINIEQLSEWLRKL